MSLLLSLYVPHYVTCPLHCFVVEASLCVRPNEGETSSKRCSIRSRRREEILNKNQKKTLWSWQSRLICSSHQQWFSMRFGILPSPLIVSRMTRFSMWLSMWNSRAIVSSRQPSKRWSITPQNAPVKSFTRKSDFEMEMGNAFLTGRETNLLL